MFIQQTLITEFKENPGSSYLKQLPSSFHGSPTQKTPKRSLFSRFQDIHHFDNSSPTSDIEFEGLPYQEPPPQQQDHFTYCLKSTSPVFNLECITANKDLQLSLSSSPVLTLDPQFTPSPQLSSSSSSSFKISKKKLKLLSSPNPMLSHWNHRKPIQNSIFSNKQVKQPFCLTTHPYNNPSPPSSPISSSRKCKNTLHNYFSNGSSNDSKALPSPSTSLVRAFSLDSAYFSNYAKSCSNEDPQGLLHSQNTSYIQTSSSLTEQICKTSDDPQQKPTSASVQNITQNSQLYSNYFIDNGERCQLPCVEAGKDALKRISCETLFKLLEGYFAELYDEYFIIDCRFAYEYEGGHIRDSLNIKTLKELESFYFSHLNKLGKKIILVFHCEFSSHRAPTMALHLRKQDRAMNMNYYPELSFPEIYVLKGGYRDFFQEFKQACVPQNYVKMTNSFYKNDLRREMNSFKKCWKRCKSFSDLN